MKKEHLRLESDFELNVFPDTEECTIKFLLKESKKETWIEISYEDSILLKNNLSLSIEKLKNEFVNQT